MKFTRRDFCTIAGSAMGSLTVGSACRRIGGAAIKTDGRLSARPHDGVKTRGAGRTKLGLDSRRDAILDLPKNANLSPLPLLVMLHGATQTADDMFWYLGSAGEETGVAVLAPNARDTTWDAITDSFGPDVDFLDRALERVFDSVAIDSSRIAVGGFSDGASYALSLGLINADLFRSVLAFSPGFIIEGALYGKPRFFISHGTHDHILPIDSCGRRVATGLKAQGYDVTFREFDGDHEIPPEVAREGLAWISK